MKKALVRKGDPDLLEKVVLSRTQVLLRTCIILALSVLALVLELAVNLLSNSVVQSWSRAVGAITK